MVDSSYFKLPILLWAMVCMGCATHSMQDGIAYKVDIDGASWKVKRAIKESTATCKLVGQPPSTFGQLQYRMDKDRDIIEAILESQGYYDGTVEFDLDESRQPARVRIDVRMGDQYRFGTVRVSYGGNDDEALARIKPRLRSGQRVVAAAVFDEESRILEQIRRRGYPFPELSRRRVEVDPEAGKVDLLLDFNPGSPATYGEVVVEGLENLDDKYIRRQVPWREGDRFNGKEVEEFERKLLETGLFSTVRASVQRPENESDAIAVQIRANERSMRTVKLGVNYSDIGPGAKGYWEHRNLFGSGEKLETTLEWNPVKTMGVGRLTRAGFLDSNQYLVLDLEAAKETPDAYDAQHVATMGMVLRDFSTRLQGGVGVGYKHSIVEQLSLSQRYAHVIFPLQAVYDSRDDALNPVRGMQLFGRAAFFNDTLGSDSFMKTQLEGRLYRMWWDRYRLSSGLRMTLGSINGASIEAVPADERYYAGGGGSIRGYEYQQVGPQIDGVPTGGDALVEFSAELRLQPGRKLGYAVFIDGGTVYNQKINDYNHSLRYGAGAGVRWFTAIGPLRIDLAYPLNPSAEQIERLQFYISLGQAF